MAGQIKMSKKMIIILTTLLATLLASSTLGGAYLVNAQEVDENQVAAENLLSLLTESEAEVTSQFETITGDGGTVPENALNAFEDAQELHTEAQTLYDEENYEESVEKATEALNKYGEALTEATPEEPEEPDVLTTEEQGEINQETENIIALTVAIDQAIIRIEKLEEIVGQLELPEDDPIVVELASLKTGLMDLKASILSGETKPSDIIFGDYMSQLAHLTAKLRGKGNPMKEAKLEQFTQQTMHRIGKLEAKMNRILAKMGSSEESALALQSQFNELLTGLEGVSKEDLKEAVNQLKQLVKETRQLGKGNDELEDIFDDDMMESINNQMKIDSKIDFYMSQIDDLVESGEMTEEIQAQLDEIVVLLEEAENALADGDKDQADEFVELAEEIMEELDGIFKGFGKANKPGYGKDNNPGKGPQWEDKPLNSKAKGKGKKSEETDDPEEPEVP
jgi:hypothetical protein